MSSTSTGSSPLALSSVSLRQNAEPERALSLQAPRQPLRVPLEFQAVYDGWFERVSSWVHALGAPEADQDDLVQDVFLIVHRRLSHFDGGNLAGWLYQIARRRVRDFRRLLWIRHLFTHSVPLSDELSTIGPGPADDLETKHKARQLDELLSLLNPDQRSAFVLLEIEGYSGKEIARLQGVPVNTVWARIHNARKKLQSGIAKASLIAGERTSR
jgi:RNA polymerase sigma-70 factor (ECF subfamily)